MIHYFWDCRTTNNRIITQIAQARSNHFHTPFCPVHPCNLRSCDKLQTATLSWRRFRTLFGRFVRGALGEKQREALVYDAHFLLRCCFFFGGCEDDFLEDPVFCVTMMFCPVSKWLDVVGECMLLENGWFPILIAFFPLKQYMSKVCPTSQFHTQLGSSTKNVGRNASWERFRTNFIHILAYLSQGEDGFPTEMCLFGEVAAFQVLAVQTGHWQAWHENLVLQVTLFFQKGFFFFSWKICFL